jgi:hypothetical protein
MMFLQGGFGNLWLENSLKKRRDISPPSIGAQDAMHSPGFPFNQRKQGGTREANREFGWGRTPIPSRGRSRWGGKVKGPDQSPKGDRRKKVVQSCDKMTGNRYPVTRVRRKPNSCVV